jgi:hypothetical protein
LFNDTVGDAGGPLLLREQIDALGELDGAVGWSSSKDRPELIAQFVAAAHVALDTKPVPRKAGGKDTRITSVKSGDLLAIPSNFWRRIFENNASFASFIGGFQHAVAGGHFGMVQCPYPASAAIYVGLRWFREFDSSPAIHWEIDKLDRLFRAFFWRNVFQSRYDQGFLTQIGTDLRNMKDFLGEVSANTNPDVWKSNADMWLDETIGPRPLLEDILNSVSDGNEKGALRRGALLLLYARASSDPVNPELNISVESGAMDLHHIYPKDWCSNNAGGILKGLLNEDHAGRDWVNSAANLVPMHRRTNNEWRKMSPTTFLESNSVSFDANPDLWHRYFITRERFDALLQGASGVEKFWTQRAQAIAQEIFDRTVV